MRMNLVRINQSSLFSPPEARDDFRAARFSHNIISVKPEQSAVNVAVILTDWIDPTRDRAVPVKIYHPENVPGPLPIIIFSHGLGGSRDTYEYLGRRWASEGFVAVHLQHLGSDSAIWQTPDAASRESLKNILLNPVNITNRTQDVSFAIDQMLRSNANNGPLRGRLNVTAVGVAGHSFGALTALQCAGQISFRSDGTEISFTDTRVNAVVAMSSPVPESVKARARETFAHIKVPCLHFTGTKDNGMAAPVPPEYRRIPFDHVAQSDQYLITFKDGDHMVFTGRRVLDHRLPKDDIIHRLILDSTTAFWNAYLKGDAAAKSWLAGGPFQAELAEHGVFEKKQIAP